MSGGYLNDIAREFEACPNAERPRSAQWCAAKRSPGGLNHDRKPTSAVTTAGDGADLASSICPANPLHALARIVCSPASPMMLTTRVQSRCP